MGLEWATDCGDHCDLAHILYDWGLESIGGGSNIAVVSGITGMTSNCLQFQSASNNATLTKNVVPASTKRFHVRCKHDLPAVSYSEIIRTSNPGMGTIAYQITIMVSSIGTVSAWLGQVLANGSIRIIDGSYTGTVKLCESGPGVIAGGATYVLSAQITYASSATGSITLYVNGQQVAAVSGVATTVDMTNQVSQFTIMQQAGSTISGYNYFDDVVIYDGTGTIPSPKRCIWMAGTGSGASTQWTHNGAATNWQCITNSTPQPDDDTTYNSAATAGLTDLFTVTVPAGISGVAGIVWVGVPRTDDGGAATLAPVLGNGVTTATGTSQPVPSSYNGLYQPYETNPLTSNPWTVADLNTLQAGYVRVS